MSAEFDRMRIAKYIGNRKVPYTRDNFIIYCKNLGKDGEALWNSIKDDLLKRPKEERYEILKNNNETFVFYNGFDEEDLQYILFSIVEIKPEMFTRYRYPGSSNNRQIKYNDKLYMVKYSKPFETDKKGFTQFRQTALTEFIASRILKCYGLNVQKVLLGYDTTAKEYCVLCEDFINSIKGNTMLLLKEESTQDTKEQRFVINDIENYLKPKLLPRIWETDKVNEKKAIDDWITMSVSDYLIGNRDRHLGNIGYKLKPDDTLEIIPIFDNGASLGCYLETKDIKEYDYLNKLDYNSYFDEIQVLYQKYNKVQVNYRNITKGKLPQVFYKKAYDILGKTDIKGLDIFDNLLKEKGLTEKQIFHIQLAKMIYIRNFNVLKTAVAKYYKGGK